MIPAQNVVAWGNLVPWTDARQIEQDLIISRALVEIFSDPIGRYLVLSGRAISRAQTQQRTFAKLANPQVRRFARAASATLAATGLRDVHQ